MRGFPMDHMKRCIRHLGYRGPREIVASYVHEPVGSLLQCVRYASTPTAHARALPWTAHPTPPL